MHPFKKIFWACYISEKKLIEKEDIKAAAEKIKRKGRR